MQNVQTSNGLVDAVNIVRCMSFRVYHSVHIVHIVQWISFDKRDSSSYSWSTLAQSEDLLVTGMRIVCVISLSKRVGIRNEYPNVRVKKNFPNNHVLQRGQMQSRFVTRRRCGQLCPAGPTSPSEQSAFKPLGSSFDSPLNSSLHFPLESPLEQLASLPLLLAPLISSKVSL